MEPEEEEVREIIEIEEPIPIMNKSVADEPREINLKYLTYFIVGWLKSLSLTILPLMFPLGSM